jgi:hypothetical protein
MLSGDFESAWKFSDQTERARLREKPVDLPRHLRRVWNGDSVDGRRVVVRCYHGLGDTIQFVRYVPMLSRRAAHLTVECQSKLLPLLMGFHDFADFIPLDSDPQISVTPEVEIELMELPYLFRTSSDRIPNTVPYLQTDQASREWAAQEIPAGGFKVGLVWGSGDWNAQRDIPLHELSKLAELDVSFVSLQRGHPQDQTSRSFRKFHFRYIENEEDSLSHTAAIIERLDLVVSVDTMVAHLAGAFGKPIFLLLPMCADWRWMIGRLDSPWYPTMRLFRQRTSGDWKPLVEIVRSEIQRLPGRRNAGYEAFRASQLIPSRVAK